MPDDDPLTEQAKNIYPSQLLKWPGHRSGGVKKPFRDGTGRPAGVRIETPLIRRVSNWAKKISAGEKAPTSILLVGGPGNGKTDTVEGVIEELEKAFQTGGVIFKAFGELYNLPDSTTPPRKVVVDLASLVPQVPDHLKIKISIVQDATESDPVRHPDKTAQSLLLEDLGEVANKDTRDLYICCVNRGKLAEAYSEAQSNDADRKVLNLLTSITNTVTSNADSTNCWPLEDYPDVIAWPMDVDSLVDSENEQDAVTALHKILTPVLDEENWKTECPAGDLCPFCTNRKELASPGAIDKLAEQLRAFELGTGKRWTFRDLYSLISYIIVGNGEELVVSGKQVSPCEWAAHQLKILDSQKKSDDAERSRAIFRLVGALYWHRLFPLWSSLGTGDYTDAIKKIIKPLNKDLQHTNDLFRFLKWSPRRKTSESISRIISERFSPLLDPANASPETVLHESHKAEKTSVQDIDEYFSLSIGQGLKQSSRKIPKLERHLLKRLEVADDALGSDSVSSQDSTKAALLQNTSRLFAARLVKRSIGTRNGAYANKTNLDNYKRALSDPKTLRRIQNQLKDLINDKRANMFVAPLMTTFAQPTPQKRRNVTLKSSPITVRAWKTNDSERPKPQLVYLSVDGTAVPVTFELYNALQQLEEGMHSGSLNDEVFAMVDRVRSRVAGRVVRDEDRLDNDTSILIESTGEEIQYVDGEFSVDVQEVQL